MTPSGRAVAKAAFGALTSLVIVAVVVMGYAVWSAYQGRVLIVDSSRQGCREDIRDRESDILVRATQAWATGVVANDPRQPQRTRNARGFESGVEAMSVRDRLTRVDQDAAERIYARATAKVREALKAADTGKRISCEQRYPSPSLLP